MTHAQMCDTDLRRCYCGAGFGHKVELCHFHRCDIAYSHGPHRELGQDDDICTDVHVT